MFATIEAEFASIMNDGRSVLDKIESVVGLHAKAQAAQALVAPLTAILEDGTKTTEQKVEEILTAVGKL